MSDRRRARVCLLAGGTGGARLAAGFQEVLEPGALTVIANTADDVEMHGLHVSPDVDSVLYRLAGMFNEDAGFGVAGETFAALDMLRRLGEDTWFALGDRDLAVHLVRTDLLRRGETLSGATLELCRRLGLASRVVPMSDDPVRTWFDAGGRRVAFQEYFVRDGCREPVRAITFDGIARARPSPAAVDALTRADLVVIGPSNPLVSVDPILRVLHAHLEPFRIVAVSPLVGGRALKGPTVEMMAALGREPSAVGVARGYAGRVRWFVIDERDRDRAAEVAALGLKVSVAGTVMNGPGAAARLARAVLDACGVAA